MHPKSGDRDDPSPLKVKEVRVEDTRRYVVCVNEDQATKDRFDREAVVASLRDALGNGDKSLVGNKGYRKFLRAGGKQFAVDEDKIKEEAGYDGKWALTTNTDLPAREVALKYKQLWMVEDVFRSMKSLLDTRPILHRCDEAIRGHLFCSFPALLLRKELEVRLGAQGVEAGMGRRDRGSGQSDGDGGCDQRQGLRFSRANSGSGGQGFSGVRRRVAAHAPLMLNLSRLRREGVSLRFF